MEVMDDVEYLETISSEKNEEVDTIRAEENMFARYCSEVGGRRTEESTGRSVEEKNKTQSAERMTKRYFFMPAMHTHNDPML